MRNSRFLPVAILAVVLSALAGGALGGSLLATAGRGLAAVPDLHVGARRDRTRIRRGAAVRSPRLRRDRRHAEDSSIRIRASSIRAAIASCVSGSRAATTGSASRFSRSTATSPSCRCSRIRPRIKKGLRRGDVIARIKSDNRPIDKEDEATGLAGRQGLDVRPGGDAAEGAEGHDGRHLASSAAATTA